MGNAGKADRKGRWRTSISSEIVRSQNIAPGVDGIRNKGAKAGLKVVTVTDVELNIVMDLSWEDRAGVSTEKV